MELPRGEQTWEKNGENKRRGRQGRLEIKQFHTMMKVLWRKYSREWVWQAYPRRFWLSWGFTDATPVLGVMVWGRVPEEGRAGASVRGGNTCVCRGAKGRPVRLQGIEWEGGHEMVSAQALSRPSKVHTWSYKGGPEGQEKRKGKSHLLLLSFPKIGELKKTLKIWIWNSVMPSFSFSQCPLENVLPVFILVCVVIMIMMIISIDN